MASGKTIPTIKLCYDYPVVYQSDPVVLSVADAGPGKSEIVLDASPFYPEGGGQPGDLGSIGGFALLAVSEDSGIVRHFACESCEVLALGGVEPGKKTHCVVDETRRQDHSCQHSCQHLLSSIVLRVLGGATKSFHLGPSWSSIDVDLPEIGIDDLLAVERELEQAIRDAYSFITHECSPGEAVKFPLRRNIPELDGVIRIVEIDGIDYTPCCGTHVRASSELTACRLLKSEKYKAMTRVYFIAGERALADYRNLARGARITGGLLGCAESEIAGLAGAQKARLADAELELKAIQDDCARYQARLLFAENLGSEIVNIKSQGYSFGYALALAKSLASLGKIGLVSCDGGLRCACAAPVSFAGFAGVLKPLLSGHGLKGGGNDAFFQAAASSEEAMDKFLESAGKGLNAASAGIGAP